MRKNLEYLVISGVAFAAAIGANSVLQSYHQLDLPLVVTKSLERLEDAEFLAEPVEVRDHYWGLLTDTTDIKGSIDYDSNTIGLPSIPTTRLGKSDSILNNYAIAILHEHSHWWFRNRLDDAKRQQFASIIKKRLQEYTEASEERLRTDKDLRRYSYLHSIQEEYQERYGERFEKEFYGSEAFATFAGHIGLELHTQTPIHALPRELLPFFRDYLHQDRIDFARGLK